ncbi:ABC transporter substrate-binding protein [Saccharopolyspora gloriosae]|uniref:ABC transporter substrate-binding protein n=1 Tax=Saccharopolyspora gloriosae TaxID=455344 RepID=UPI001FB5A0D0|nr:ABC transporter substrate-binding protein [Saccharopolyspora gloriosae]
MGRKILVALVVLGGLLMPNAAIAQPSAGGAAKLRVAVPQQIDSLNPFLGYSLAATDLFRLIYPTLTTYSPQDFSATPELAERWETSPDKLTWTFHIRPGVQWTDGQPVTARDAAYTYDRMMHDPAAATANGNFVENFESVSAPDDGTLVIRTKTPQSTMLAIDAPIVPEHVWSKVDDVAGFANDRMPVVGSGPFELTEYEPEQYAMLRANPRFWRGPPKVSELQFVQFKNTDASVQALRKGEVDVAQKLTPAQFDALADEPDVEQVKGQGRRFFEMLINPGAANSAGAPIGTGHPALRDVRVRRAIDQAINKQALVDRVLNGYGQVGGGYLPPIFDDYHWTPPQPRGFDPAAANAQLDAAGYRRGPDGIRRTPQGEPLNLGFMLHASTSADAQVGEFVKRWLADVGIAVELEPVSDNQVNDRTTAGDFDLAISGWSANPDPDYVLRLQTCGSRPSPEGGGTPDSFLCDQQYDDLYARQLGEFDPAKRIDLVKQAQRRFYDQATASVLYYQNSLEAHRSDRYSGFTTQPAAEGVITGQQGYWGYYGAQPTPAAMNSQDTDYGTVAWVLVGIVVIAGVVILLVVRHRRATVDERE